MFTGKKWLKDKKAAALAVAAHFRVLQYHVVVGLNKKKKPPWVARIFGQDAPCPKASSEKAMSDTVGPSENCEVESSDECIITGAKLRGDECSVESSAVHVAAMVDIPAANKQILRMLKQATRAK